MPNGCAYSIGTLDRQSVRDDHGSVVVGDRCQLWTITKCQGDAYTGLSPLLQQASVYCGTLAVVSIIHYYYELITALKSISSWIPMVPSHGCKTRILFADCCSFGCCCCLLVREIEEQRYVDASLSSFQVASPGLKISILALLLSMSKFCFSLSSSTFHSNACVSCVLFHSSTLDSPPALPSSHTSTHFRIL